MKKLLYLLPFLLFCFSCENQLLPTPGIGDDQNQSQTGNESGTWAAPQNLSATQGQKQEITLSWNSVKKAVRYYIYRADTPYDAFKQIGETTDAKTTYTLKVPSGTDKYYKVTAVDATGKETPHSLAARGTSLAQPVISDIQGSAGEEDSAIHVYWYMGNVDAYQKSVRYTIICSDARNTEIARVSVDGSITVSTQATFTNLTPNTSYNYKVEAFLVSAQNNTEISETVDAATARRLRPNPPENVTATEGTSKNSITLSFILPEFVDVAVSNGVYEQNPLYFKIYRRIRAADGQQPSSYMPICAYFGKAQSTAGKQNFGSETYEPGATVSYTDSVDLTRGVIYEYKVQSFADDTTREITSDLSYAETSGWMLASASFKTTSFKQTLGTDENNNPIYVAAELGFDFSWNAIGKDADYHFILEEMKYKLEGDNGSVADMTGTKQDFKIFTSIAAVNEYKRNFDLSGSNALAVRGYYKYKLYIIAANQTDTNGAADSVAAVGQILVTNDTTKPKINTFSVTSGYKDKFEISWDYNPSYKYELRYSTGNPEDPEVVITEMELDSIITDTVESGDIVTYTDAAISGDKRTYTLYAKSSVTANTDSIMAETLNIPEPIVAGYAYDSVTIKWPIIEAEKFRLGCAYKDNPYGKDLSSLTVEPQKTDLIADENGYLLYTFEKPDGYNDARISGRAIEVSISAISKVIKKTLTLQENETYAASESEINTDSTGATVISATMGPALTKPKATQSASTDMIKVTWKKVTGAPAYAVIRNYYETPSSANTEVPKSAEKYLVTITESKPVVSLIGGIDDNISTAVSITESADGSYTLTDTAIRSITNENSSWQLSQSRLSWGSPYDYVIIPLASADDIGLVEYDKSETNKIVIGSVTLTNISDVSLVTRGSTLGYGWNVQASKGWQTASLTGDVQSAANTSVHITWDKPSLAATISPTYKIYRRIEGTSTWDTISGNCTVQFYEDTTAVPGVVYEYAVGLITGIDSKPITDTAYIVFSGEIKDSVYTAEKRAAGCILPLPKITSASRTDIGVDSEEIKWTAAENGAVYNRMIDGYVIEVLNYNISPDWKIIKELTFGEAGFTAQNTYTQRVDNNSGLLKVLRDYKHYFRIRTFTQNEDGKRTYSQAPQYTWSDGAENEYVKWGARQITPEEFAEVAAISIGESMYNNTYCSSSSSSYDWHFNFKNNGPYYLNISGYMNSNRGAWLSGKPHTHGQSGHISKQNPNTATITLILNELLPNSLTYNGTVKITSFSSSDGSFIVMYNDNEIDYSSKAREYIPFR